MFTIPRDVKDTRKAEAIVPTGRTRQIAANGHVGDEAGSIQGFLIDEQVKTVVKEGRPGVIWEASAKSGEQYIEQTSAILDDLIKERRLAKFRVGFNNYYALPKVALTEEIPDLKTIVSDSLKSLFLTLRYKSIKKREVETNVPQ